jgi:hypothetical protein
MELCKRLYWLTSHEVAVFRIRTRSKYRRTTSGRQTDSHCNDNLSGAMHYQHPELEIVRAALDDPETIEAIEMKA